MCSITEWDFWAVRRFIYIILILYLFYIYIYSFIYFPGAKVNIEHWQSVSHLDD